jgi:tRNA (adenine37-N6)-methyltransferase
MYVLPPTAVPEAPVPFRLEPVAFVASSRKQPRDDNWDAEKAEIRLADGFDAAVLAGLESFSHIEVIYVFHRVESEDIVKGARHPRGNSSWPRTGIFAQRAKNRPNRLGSTICRLDSAGERVLHVSGLDAIDGTPVVDIKPVLREFLPRGEVTQPKWATELMRGYWKQDTGSRNDVRPDDR